ncbi:hypothetical protein QWZ08_25045 [Ferruginibacter paludis]|nr:hypothetical protein [Ferruginibacter paludis]
MEDKLTDFEQSEYYNAWLKSKTDLAIVLSILTFILGFVIVRAVYVR